jgi:hypothetical protein
MPEHDSISVCVYAENDGLYQLGERINARFEDAYMNGYNWDALIRCYVASLDPALMDIIEADPEAGMYSAYMSFSPENLEQMQRFETNLRTMLADEAALMQFIETHYEDIEWDSMGSQADDPNGSTESA